jgi:hypothetical protein
MTALPPPCVDLLEIWESQTAVTVRVYPGLYRESFTFTVQEIPHYLEGGNIALYKKHF